MSETPAKTATSAKSTLREQWAAGESTFGVWLTIPSTVSAEAAARVGYDYVCIDTQHGAVDYSDCVTMFQAIEYGGGLPIARVPWNEPGIIGKTLDAGAQGVIVPMVNSRAEAEAVISAVRYPPLGMRSYGPAMVGMRHRDYHEWSFDAVAAIPMIETVEAVKHLDDILSVPGIDAIYVGPADLSASLGLKPKNNDDQSVFMDALAAIVAGCRRHGVVPGIHATADLVATRIEQGFRMITVASDVLAMRASLAKDLTTARGAHPTTPTTPSPLY